MKRKFLSNRLVFVMSSKDKSNLIHAAKELSNTYRELDKMIELLDYMSKVSHLSQMEKRICANKIQSFFDHIWIIEKDLKSYEP